MAFILVASSASALELTYKKLDTLRVEDNTLFFQIDCAQYLAKVSRPDHIAANRRKGIIYAPYSLKGKKGFAIIGNQTAHFIDFKKLKGPTKLTFNPVDSSYKETFSVYLLPSKKYFVLTDEEAYNARYKKKYPSPKEIIEITSEAFDNMKPDQQEKYAKNVPFKTIQEYYQQNGKIFAKNVPRVLYGVINYLHANLADKVTNYYRNIKLQRKVGVGELSLAFGLESNCSKVYKSKGLAKDIRVQLDKLSKVLPDLNYIKHLPNTEVP